MSFGPARPLVSTAGCAAGAYVIAMGLQLRAGGLLEVSLRALIVCAAGGLYANLFEHAWHRYAMHGRRPDRRHAMHHRLFHGKAFQTSDPEAMREIVTAWYIFPALLALHYTAFAALFGTALAAGFFLGVLLHFVTYEVTHWYTHVANNGFDRFISRVPGLRRWRATQIEHHRLHHGEPGVNFNFNPPYAGDRIGRVLRR